VSLFWIFPLLVGQRLLELVISRRNQRLIEARGGREFYPNTFLAIAFLHTLFIVSLLIESVPWRVPANALTWCCLGAYVLLQGLRYWCMASLGIWWNARIVLLPGGEVSRKGPYRFMRHPNYLVVMLEFVLLPLLLRSPITFAAYFPVNILILRHRIVLEEQALREQTDYSAKFPAPRTDG